MRKGIVIAIVTTIFTLRLISSAALASAAADEKTRAEVAVLLVGAVSNVNLDTDIVYARDFELFKMLLDEFRIELAELGLDVGKLDERIAPMSRSVSQNAASASDDVLPSSHWVYGALKTLAEDGLINPYVDTRNKAFYSMPLEISGGHFFGDKYYYSTSTSSPRETARYGEYDDNPVKIVARDPLATFSLDVNTTSYANVRRFLNGGRLPDFDAVRVEELINYFPAAAQDMEPSRLGGSPFYAAYELAPCPWNDNNTLLWVSLTAQEMDYKKAPPANLVFLVDVSGSMNPPERLPLAKSALITLVGRLRPEDSISLVTYAGATAVALEAAKGSEKAKILAAIDSLGAGGSTAGAAGLALAYEQARNGFIKGGINRILLCTDGDFNVGVSGTKELEAMVTREKDSGVTLSILGFGGDNLNDEMMTRISSVGNGNYGYVDSMSEARKILGEEMAATFVTMAKDVKAQIEFNPANVIEYRQIGYEKRQLKNEDFNNDQVDAGDVGAGKRVTILYELTLAGAKPSVDPLRYQPSQGISLDEFVVTDMKSDELAYLKFRWKEPDGVKSSLAEIPIMKSAIAETFEKAGTALRFSTAVAAYGQKLRDNPNLAGVKWREIKFWAEGSRGDDPYRAEFVQLVKLADSLYDDRSRPYADH